MRRIFAIAAALLLAGCAPAGREAGHEGEHGHHDGDEAPVERGPHGGRLLRSGDLALELSIEEAGIPPEFRAHLHDRDGDALPAAAGRLTVWLTRFGGRRDSIPFTIVGDEFRGTRTVEEPHSFDARVVLEREGARHEWTYRQREGRLTLAPEAVAASGIRIGVAGPHAIDVRVEAPGEVRLNAERVVQIRPRFPGLLRALDRSQGDEVRAGERVAVVHSNESLTDYEITAPLSGTVVAREAVAGQNVEHESVLYTIADLSTVWVDLALDPQIAGRVRRGQSVRVRAEAGTTSEATAPIAYVGPLLEQDTRVSYARVVLPNAGNRWQPGLFVTASITLGRVQARVAVPEDAIVRSRLGPAVFRAEGTTFELQPVVTGESDGTWTEILEGLAAGEAVVVGQAFLLKAELGKSEATHDH